MVSLLLSPDSAETPKLKKRYHDLVEKSLLPDEGYDDMRGNPNMRHEEFSEHDSQPPER